MPQHVTTATNDPPTVSTATLAATSVPLPPTSRAAEPNQTESPSAEPGGEPAPVPPSMQSLWATMQGGATLKPRWQNPAPGVCGSCGQQAPTTTCVLPKTAHVYGMIDVCGACQELDRLFPPDDTPANCRAQLPPGSVLDGRTQACWHCGDTTHFKYQGGCIVCPVALKTQRDRDSDRGAPRPVTGSTSTAAATAAALCIMAVAPPSFRSIPAKPPTAPPPPGSAPSPPPAKTIITPQTAGPTPSVPPAPSPPAKSPVTPPPAGSSPAPPPAVKPKTPPTEPTLPVSPPPPP
eukprot:gene5385-7384_t